MAAGVIVILALLWCFIGAAVGAAIGNTKGRAIEGGWLGFFLGWIGWIIVALLQSTPDAEARHLAEVGAARARQELDAATTDEGPLGRRPCPFCAESIMSSAILCRFCGRDVDPIPARDHGDARGQVELSFVCPACSAETPTPGDAFSATCSSPACRRRFEFLQCPRCQHPQVVESGLFERCWECSARLRAWYVTAVRPVPYRNVVAFRSRVGTT